MASSPVDPLVGIWRGHYTYNEQNHFRSNVYKLPVEFRVEDLPERGPTFILQDTLNSQTLECPTRLTGPHRVSFTQVRSDGVAFVYEGRLTNGGSTLAGTRTDNISRWQGEFELQRV